LIARIYISDSTHGPFASETFRAITGCDSLFDKRVLAALKKSEADVRPAIAQYLSSLDSTDFAPKSKSKSKKNTTVFKGLQKDGRDHFVSIIDYIAMHCGKLSGRPKKSLVGYIRDWSVECRRSAPQILRDKPDATPGTVPIHHFIEHAARELFGDWGFESISHEEHVKENIRDVLNFLHQKCWDNDRKWFMAQVKSLERLTVSAEAAFDGEFYLYFMPQSIPNNLSDSSL
jgi:hypothetical protein